MKEFFIISVYSNAQPVYTSYLTQISLSDNFIKKKKSKCLNNFNFIYLFYFLVKLWNNANFSEFRKKSILFEHLFNWFIENCFNILVNQN